jgi:hypothetical protein
MTRLVLNRRAWLGGLVGAAAMLVSSCSLLYDLSGNQCMAQSDCDALGPGLECVEHVCRAIPAGGGGAGGAGATGGSSGEGAGGATGGTGDEGTGGEAPECTSNGDCIDARFEPSICKDGSCVNLISTECPLVLGGGDEDLENLRKPAPIIVGAYSNFEPLQVTAKSAYNYELAFEEFNRATVGGLPGGPNGTRRPLIAVVCTSRDDDVEPSIDHLVGTIGVPGIIAALTDDKLQTAFEYAHGTLQADVFFLSPFGANDALRTLADDGLVWHMLGNTDDLAAPFVPLVNRAEDYQNGLRASPPEPLKVLLVESDYSFNPTLAELVTRSIAFNGYPALDDENKGNFTRVQIQSGLVHNTPDVSDAVDALDPSDPPQLVLLFTTREFFERVIESFETRFDETLGEPRPLYLMSPFLANESEVLTKAEDPALPTLAERLLGANFVVYDSRLYDQYYNRLTSTFSQASVPLASTENYYDAAYFMIYSFAAAGALSEYSGYDLVDGMKKLVRDDVQTSPCVGAEGCFEIDDTRIVATVNYLRGTDVSSAGISLVGTMGPPVFDRSQGVRLFPTSVWCVDGSGGAGGAGGLQFVPDVLNYDVKSMTLTGEYPCLAGF